MIGTELGVFDKTVAKALVPIKPTKDRCERGINSGLVRDGLRAQFSHRVEGIPHSRSKPLPETLQREILDHGDHRSALTPIHLE